MPRKSIFEKTKGVRTFEEFLASAKKDSEKLTLDACSFGAYNGRVDMMTKYFEINPMNEENLDCMMAQAIYADRLDLVMKYAGKCTQKNLIHYMKMACCTYSQECADYMANCLQLEMCAEEKERWLKEHGSTEERHELAKILSHQNWGPADCILRAANAERISQLDDTLRLLKKKEEAEELYSVVTNYGCRDPEVLSWAADAARKKKSTVYYDIIYGGRCYLF